MIPPRILATPRAIHEVLDGLAIGALLGVLADFLTVWASLWTVLWLSVRIYESDTFQKWWFGRSPDEDEDDS